MLYTHSSHKFTFLVAFWYLGIDVLGLHSVLRGVTSFLLGPFVLVWFQEYGISDLYCNKGLQVIQVSDFTFILVFLFVVFVVFFISLPDN